MVNKHLRNIKAVFADVDNTLLCIKIHNPESGKRMVGFPEYKEWLKYNVFYDAYSDSHAPRGMFNLINALHENGAKIYGLTECSNSFEYNSKCKRLIECYPNIFNHHDDLISIDDRHKKVLVMEMICERDGLKPAEVMFIDDSYSEVMEAFSKGFFSMHTTEAMERFYIEAKFADIVDES